MDFIFQGFPVYGTWKPAHHASKQTFLGKPGKAFVLKLKRGKLLGFGWTKMKQKIIEIESQFFSICNSVFLSKSMVSNNELNQ